MAPKFLVPSFLASPLVGMSQSPQVVWVREPPSPFPATYHMDVPWGPNPTARTTSASTPMEHSGFPKVIFHPSLLHGAGVSHQALNPQTQQLSHYASLSPPKKKNPFHPPQGCSPGEGFRVSPIPKPPSSAAQPLAPKPHLQPPTPTMLQDDPEAPSPTISANVGYLSPPQTPFTPTHLKDAPRGRDAPAPNPQTPSAQPTRGITPRPQTPLSTPHKDAPRGQAHPSRPPHTPYPKKTPFIPSPWQWDPPNPTFLSRTPVPIPLPAAGVRPTDPGALPLARAIAEEAPGEVTLVGVYAHCGNTYGCSGVPAIQAIARATTAAVLDFVAA